MPNLEGPVIDDARHGVNAKSEEIDLSRFMSDGLHYGGYQMTLIDDLNIRQYIPELVSSVYSPEKKD
jgi:hypothetical protein